MYKCVFTHNYARKSVLFHQSKGLDLIKDGFWVDRNLEMRGDGEWEHVVYWIPPSQILYVKKVKVKGAKHDEEF